MSRECARYWDVECGFEHPAVMRTSRDLYFASWKMTPNV